MTKLNQKDFKSFQINENLQQIYGGTECGTDYKKDGVKIGDDTYTDNDCSGGLSTGDTVLLDNGQTIIKS